MKILITGATGLIGKELGQALVAEGHTLVAIVRDKARAQLELPFPAEVFEWRNRTDAFPIEAWRGVEAVVNLAGAPIAGVRWNEAVKSEIYDSRVLSTRLLVDSMIAARGSHRVSVFVQGSATGIYGDAGDTLLDETALAAGDFLAKTVIDWEHESDRAASAGGRDGGAVTGEVRVVKIRTAPVLSRYGGALMQMLPVFARGLGGRLSLGQQWMSWIHIRDIVAIFQFALRDSRALGAINGAAPEPLRNERFTCEFARALKRSVFLPVPEVAIKTMFGEVASVLLGSQRVVSKKLSDWGFEFQFSEFVPAIRELCEPLQNGQREVCFEQWLPLPPDQIFPYFSAEKNLEELTPSFLKFRVLGKNTPSIERGTLIDYRLSIHGVPARWQTEITDWQPNRVFVDEQRSGPYRRWVHTHEFNALGGGTLMRDRVQYKLPLGLVGDVVGHWQVARDVQQIFDYRRRIIFDRFGTRQS